MGEFTSDLSRKDTGTPSDLESALHEARLKQFESSELLDAAQSIPMAENFAQSARAIFDSCCKVTGATAGYVALLNDAGDENEVLFLEAGGLPCTVDPNLPMPIRGLRGVSYETSKAVYDNDFSNSKWMKFMPEGHVSLKNVMFSPINVGGKTVGLIGLANKDGDFTDRDAANATTFGEMASVALRFARYQDQLKRWAHVFEDAKWGVAVGDPEYNSLEMINPAFAEMHGYTLEELASKPISTVFAESARETLVQQLGLARDKGHHTFETENVRKDGSVFPAQVDVTMVEEKEPAEEGHGEAEEAEGAPSKYYVFNVQDITERKAAADALMRSNIELRQYASVAAHQLQEPLRLISSYTQLLSRRYAGKLDAEASEFIEYAVSGSERLQRLLDGLLVYTQVGIDPEAVEAVDCSRLVSEVVNDMSLVIDSSGAEVVVGELPSVRANRKELFQLFRHMLQNAIDNAGSGQCRIEVSAEREEGAWHLSVKDNGIGIAPRHHERIFGLFTRLQGPAEGAGTGIGLALCKKIVERYGGRIWVESEEGEGAGFHFTFPV
ncbi:MAG: ATP-binding protein [Sedimenticola sp.]